MKCPFCGSDEVQELVEGQPVYNWVCVECGESWSGDDPDLPILGHGDYASPDDQEPDSSGGWPDDDPEFDRFLIDNGLMHDPDGDVIDL